MNAGTFACSGGIGSRLGERRAPGIGAASHAGPPRAARRAWRARASSARPSCSIRTDAAVYDRPSRSSATATSSGPTAGAAAKCSESERSGRPPPPPPRARATPRGSRRSGRGRRTSARAPTRASARRRALERRVGVEGVRRRERHAGASRSPIRACSRASGRGAHQFHSPSSFISDGTSSARTIVASISTASAVPSAELLDEDHLRRRRTRRSRCRTGSPRRSRSARCAAARPRPPRRSAARRRAPP